MYEQKVPNTTLSVRVIDDGKSLKVVFNQDFYVHKEVTEGINYYLQNYIYNQTISQKKIYEVSNWFAGYLGIAFQLGIAQMNAFPGCQCIRKGY